MIDWMCSSTRSQIGWPGMDDIHALGMPCSERGSRPMRARRADLVGGVLGTELEFDGADVVGSRGYGVLVMLKVDRRVEYGRRHSVSKSA